MIAKAKFNFTDQNLITANEKMKKVKLLRQNQNNNDRNFFAGLPGTFSISDGKNGSLTFEKQLPIDLNINVQQPGPLGFL